MDFAQLQTRVASYLIDVPSATTAEIPGWINAALHQAQDRHNFRFMEAETSFVTVAATRLLGNLPAGWKEHRALPWLEDVNGHTREIAWAASRSESVRLFGDSTTLDIGVPRLVLEAPDGTLEVYPYPDGRSLHPDGEYRITVPYWSRLPDLVNGNDENWFTTHAAEYLTFYAVAEGLVFNREEERASVYVSKAEIERARLVRRDKRSRLDNRMTLGFYSGARGTQYQGRRM